VVDVCADGAIGGAMKEPVDLDALMRLHGETVQGEWKACRACTGRGSGCRIVWAPDGNHTIFESGDAAEVPTTGTPADAAFVVAAHNSLPALVAEVRALREVAEAARSLTDWDWLHLLEDDVAPGKWAKEVRNGVAQIEAALARVPR
jgi:hypothetical protein